MPLKTDPPLSSPFRMSKRILAVASTALFLLTACNQGPAGVTVGNSLMVKEKTIVENAASADTLKTLVGAVRSAKLETTLAGEGPFTVFAPTDQAFAALPEGALQALLKPENADLLTQLLTYHVVPGKVLTNQMTNGMRLRTTEGKELTIETDGKGMVKVNGVQVAIADVPASNGVVHVIDAVLLPPVGGETVSSSSSSSSMDQGTMNHSSSAQAQVQSSTRGSSSVVVGVMMEKGVMYRILDNGVKEQQKVEMQMENGIRVKPDGSLTSPDGRTAKLEEGQVLAMNGTVGPAKDGLPRPATASSSAAQKPAGPEYGVYTEGVVGNGKTSVLFFHAEWCPVCRGDDKKIADWYAKETFKVATYRVNYDTSEPLKKKYGVTYQHTFVKIDGTGKAIQTVQNPTEDQLLSLLRG